MMLGQPQHRARILEAQAHDLAVAADDGDALLDGLRAMSANGWTCPGVK